MAQSSLDSTRVLDMMKEFDNFLGRPSSTSYRTPPFSSTIKEEGFSPFNPKLSPLESRDYDFKRYKIEKEAEVNHLQATIVKLKSKSESEEPAAKKVCIELEKNAEISKQQYEREKEKNLHLIHQLQLLEKELVSSRASLSANIDQAKKLNEQLENKLAASYKKVQLLQVEVEEFRMDNSETVKQLKLEVNRLKADVELANHEVSQSKEQLKIVTRQMEERSAMEKETLKVERDAKIRELEHQLASREEDEVIGRSMKGELQRLKEVEKNYHTLQEGNKLLMERHENMLLLKENVVSLKDELACEQKRSNTVHHLTLEKETLKNRLADWEELGSVHGENCSPASISRYLSRLQKTEALLQEECGQLRADVRVLEATTKKLQAEKDQSNGELEQQKRIKESQIMLLRKAQRKELLLSKENESYKKLIKSYEEDVTLNISEANKERIEMLENLVARYKMTLNEFCSTDSHSSGSTEKEIMLQREIENLRVTLSRVKEESQQKQEKQINSERILHYRMNPFEKVSRQSAADIQNLREENHRLKIRLQVLEERGSQAIDVTAEMKERLQEKGSAKTVEALQEELNRAKMKNKRYMEAWKKTSKEFREVCYMLTGYRIDTPTPKQYKLSHMYAESEHDCLLFKETSEEKLQLLETEYSKTLTNLIELHLGKHDSIPAFLSSLTMELFFSQTCMLEDRSQT